MRTLAAGRGGPAELVTDLASLRAVLRRDPAAAQRLTEAPGVEQVVISGVRLELSDAGHRALWRLTIHWLQRH